MNTFIIFIFEILSRAFSFFIVIVIGLIVYHLFLRFLRDLVRLKYKNKNVFIRLGTRKDYNRALFETIIKENKNECKIYRPPENKREKFECFSLFASYPKNYKFPVVFFGKSGNWFFVTTKEAIGKYLKGNKTQLAKITSQIKNNSFIIDRSEEGKDN